jgi:hypothetical protein
MITTMKQYTFKDFEFWPRTVHESIDDFLTRFGMHPNIMCAAAEVWRAVDLAVQEDLQNVVNDKGEHPGPDDTVELSGFNAPDCHLTFCIHELPAYPAFLLIFDEDPSFDGEPEFVDEDEGSLVAAVRYAV